MNYYEILIKSHTDAPDYEDSCEAESIEVARVIFEGRTKTDIDVKDIVERTLESEIQDIEPQPHVNGYSGPITK
jgi:hypothetical protein